MIFIVLGSQKFQFNRLLIELDKLKSAGKISDEIIAQTGYSDYTPSSINAIDFIEKKEFDQYVSEADTVICHGGTGAIVSSLKKGKKVIAVPRDSKFSEHVDNHQFQIVEMFADLNLIEPCYDCENLFEAFSKSKIKNYNEFKSNNLTFMSEVRKDIESLVRKPK